MDIVTQPLGTEGQLQMKLVDGKLIISIAHLHASGKIELVAEQDACYFLDKLAALIPGTFDDAVIAIAKQAIKAA